MAEPGWVREAIWWHVYPIGFTGADPTGADRRPAGRLTRLAEWLDYAVQLGVSGIALGPIFESSSHGYDTLDYYRIDSRLGDEADFDALVVQARDRGLRVLLDGVFNHVGRDFPAFQQVLAQGSDAPSAEWFVRDPHGEGAEDGYTTFEGHPGLVSLNHEDPGVADLVVDVMCHWLARGADGWRLDAAYAVPPAFWADVTSRVRESHPDAYLMGEWIHGDYDTAVEAAGLDAVTQYEMWKAVWSSLNDRNFFELSAALERHNGWLETFVPYTFLGNHDVTRIASRLTDPGPLAHALVVLCTVGGTPAIYYGDEQAFGGEKEERFGGDDAVRPAFPASPADLDQAGWSTYRLHQELIGLRRRHPWLHSARTEVVSLANEQLVYDVTDGANRARVCLNLADSDLEDDLADAEVLAGAATTGADGTVVPGGGWAVLRP